MRGLCFAPCCSHQRPMQVQIHPAHQAVTAAREALLAEAPGAAQFPVQTVRGDCIQFVECQHGNLRVLRRPMLGNLRAVVGDPAHAGRRATAGGGRGRAASAAAVARCHVDVTVSASAAHRSCAHRSCAHAMSCRSKALNWKVKSREPVWFDCCRRLVFLRRPMKLDHRRGHVEQVCQHAGADRIQQDVIGLRR